MFPKAVETASLELRPLAEAVDVLELYDAFAERTEGTEAVFEYVPQEPFSTPKDARDWLDDAGSEWDAGEGAKYAVFVADGGDGADGDDGAGGADERQDGDPGGPFAGLAGASVDWDRRTGNLGVILARDHWGQGYAGECAAALTELCFERLDLELVALSFESGNDRSHRAIETFVDRVGGRKDGVLRNWTPVGDEVLDSHRYTVSRAEYHRAGSGSADPA